MKYSFKFLLSLSTVLLLTACGFHLRDQNTLPQQLHIIYLQTDDPYGRFTAQLKQALHSAGVTLVDTEKQAPIMLQITNTNLKSSSPVITNSTETSIYNYTYTVSFLLKTTQGDVILGKKTAKSYYKYILNSGQAIDSTNDEDNVQQAMYQEAILQIFNYLNAEKTRQALLHIKT